MIDEKRLTKALVYLAETDEPCAGLKADMERAEFKAKATKDAIFLRLADEEVGKRITVTDRVAMAGASKEYDKAMSLYFDFLKLYEAMRNKRGTETIVVDVWRSINSARTKGVIQ